MVTLHLTILTLPKGVAHRATHRKHERGNKPQRGIQNQRRGRNSHLPEQGNKKPHAIHTDKAKKTGRTGQDANKNTHTHKHKKPTRQRDRPTTKKNKTNARMRTHTSSHTSTHHYPPARKRTGGARARTPPTRAGAGVESAGGRTRRKGGATRGTARTIRAVDGGKGN
jgi:hypothetical protein